MLLLENRARPHLIWFAIVIVVFVFSFLSILIFLDYFVYVSMYLYVCAYSTMKDRDSLCDLSHSTTYKT